MGYVALYRRWRPQGFDDVVGQPHVVRTLKNAIAAGKVTHAYLFAGPRGTGKTSTARVLAKALNCEKGPTVEPCGVCASCIAVRDGYSMDVVEIDAASNRGIDDIRDLRDKVVYAPTQGRYRVYIIDEAHMLTPQAFNALLKTLEEPPAHAVFVLATTQADSILPTIVSRCQRFDFNRLTVADLAAHVKKVAASQSISIHPDAARLIARRADGSARDALGLLEQAAAWSDGVTAATVAEMLGSSPEECLSKFADVIADHDAGAVFGLIQQQVDEGADLRQFASDLIGHFRNLLVAREAPGRRELLDLGEEAYGALAAQSARFSREQLVGILSALSDTEVQLKRTSSPRVCLEIAAVGLCLPAPGKGIATEAAAVSVPVPAPAPVRVTQSPSAPVATATPASSAQASPEPTVVSAAGTDGRGEGGRLKGISEAQWAQVRARLKPLEVVLDALLVQTTAISVDGDHCTLLYDPGWIVHAQKVCLPDNRAKLERALSEVLGRPMTCSATTSAQDTAASSAAGSSTGKGKRGVVRDAVPVPSATGAADKGRAPQPTGQEDLRSHPSLRAAVELFDPKEIRTIQG